MNSRRLGPLARGDFEVPSGTINHFRRWLGLFGREGSIVYLAQQREQSGRIMTLSLLVDVVTWIWQLFLVTVRYGTARRRICWR